MSILGQTSVMNISGLVCLSPASMKVQQPRLLVMNSAWPWNRAALQGQPTGHIACTFQAYSHTASFSHHRPSPTPEFFFFFCSVGSSFLHPGFLWCGKLWLLFIAVCRLLIALVSLVAEHRLQQLWLVGLVAQKHEVARNLPGPGTEPRSPALSGRFLTTGPPGKSLSLCVLFCF